MQDIEVQEGYAPGAIGRIVQLHGTYYHRYWKFGLHFESKVATELSEFLGRYVQARDGFWTARRGERIEGAIAIDGQDAHEHGAQLRWFILSDVLRGKGVGTRLIRTAIEFCRGRSYAGIYLWTFSGLDAARHLYEKAGFRLTVERAGTRWGAEVLEQRFDLKLR